MTEIKTHDGQKYLVTESFDEVMESLSISGLQRYTYAIGKKLAIKTEHVTHVVDNSETR